MDIPCKFNTKNCFKAWARALIPTGLSIQLPEGFEAQIRARSGLAIKYGMGQINGIGTIDSDYRGELRFLINWGDEDFVIRQ